MEKVATWFAIFIFYSFAGWLIEVLISFIQKRKIINRGFLVGPICPIYGTGALLLPFIVSSVETPLVIFCVAVVGSAILEYVVSYLMEKIFVYAGGIILISRLILTDVFVLALLFRLE